MVDETTTDTAEETVENESQEMNFLDMSDDDVAGMSSIPSFDDDTEEEPETSSETSEDVVDEDTTETGEEEVDESTDNSTDDDGDEASDDSGDEPSGEVEETTDTESSEDSDNTTEDDKAAKAIADMDKLLSPFKANGREIKIDNVDDAIKLMQMGANYNRKMAALKPNLKIVKMLENNDLLDEGKLAYLIDISKKKPEAVKQLLKDSGMDPQDIDVDSDTGYQPETYTVNDEEIELDMVLSDLRDTPKFSETMSIINTKFDAASKKVLVESPDIIRVLNEHVELGIYDKIANVVERERMLGRLTGLNDLQAYKHVSDAINAQGGLPRESASANESTTTATKPATKQDATTKARKKSAAVTKSTPSKKTVENKYDPLAMSDEEIEKLGMSAFM